MDFVWDNPGEPAPEETFATHTHRGHQSFPICIIHPLRSMASSLFKSHTWQSFTTISLQVFYGLLLGLAHSTSYSTHLFIQSLSSFCNTCPYHHNLIHYSTETMSFNPSLTLNPLLGNLSCRFTQYIHLTILISSHTYRPGLTSMQHTTSHTTAVQSPSHFQLYILIGKQRNQLPEFIPSNSDSVLHSCISISIHTQLVT